jgi:ATP-dependent Clp protease ATP-binding subunit ClpA
MGVLQVLLRRTKHNPLLIGEAGVGKTAVSTLWSSLKQHRSGQRDNHKQL